MSRTGKLPVEFDKEVKVDIDNGVLTVKGPKGELKYDFGKKIKISISDNSVLVERKDDSNEQKSLHGTIRSLIQNMVTGVTEGFEKSLEIVGVGFRVTKKDNVLELNIGFSHPINFQIPEGVEVNVEKNTIKVSGVDKQLVGQVAANIRQFKKPEPYKGKGIKYTDEIVRRKAGKAAKAVGSE